MTKKIMTEYDDFLLVRRKWKHILKRALDEPKVSIFQIIAETADSYPYKKYLYGCVYCSGYRYIEPECNGCPLCINEKPCFDEDRPYGRIKNLNTKEENIQAIKDLIEEINNTKPLK